MAGVERSRVEMELERVREELQRSGYSVVRGILPTTTIMRARGHLEKCVEKHLAEAVTKGDLDDACSGLPLEERMASAYHAHPEAAPCSWVPQTRNSFVFQQLLFRDSALCGLISALTDGRPVEVASRYNCRCKLPAAAGASFPWHQDHAFFRMQYLLKKEAPKRLLAAWAPLVHVDAVNGGVELCPASHRLGFQRHGRHRGFLAVAPDGVLPAAATAESGCELPTLEPGDVLLFTDLTLHRSGLNTSDTARWSADWAYELLDSDPITPMLEPPREEASPAEPADVTATVETAVEQQRWWHLVRPFWAGLVRMLTARGYLQRRLAAIAAGTLSVMLCGPALLKGLRRRTPLR